MSGLFGKLGGIRNAVKEGISEFSRDALGESRDLVNDTAKNAATRAAAVATNAAKTGKAASEAAKTVTKKLGDARKKNLSQNNLHDAMEEFVTDQPGSSQEVPSADDLSPPDTSTTSAVLKDRGAQGSPTNSSSGEMLSAAKVDSAAADDWDLEGFVDEPLDDLPEPATSLEPARAPASHDKQKLASAEKAAKSPSLGTPTGSSGERPKVKAGTSDTPSSAGRPKAKAGTPATPASADRPKAKPPSSSSKPAESPSTSPPEESVAKKSAAKPAAQPAAKPAVQPAAKPAAQLITKNAAKAAAPKQPAGDDEAAVGAAAGPEAVESVVQASSGGDAAEHRAEKAAWVAEKERLELLCAELRSALDGGAQQQQDTAAERDALQARLHASEEANALLQAKVKALQGELERAHSEKDETVAEREDVESRVEELAASLEARMEELTRDLAQRDGEIEKLREENDKQSEAFDELKHLLQQSVDDRDRLADELKDTERVLVEVRRDLQESQDALEQSRRKMAEESASLAQERARLETLETTSLGAADRLALEDKLAHANSRIAETLQEVRGLQEKLADAEKRAADNESSWLAASREAESTKAALADAQAAAEAEKVERMEVVGETERLKGDSERRAKTFNNAVAAAVAKIKSTLEAERDALAETADTLQQQAQALQERIGELEAAVEVSEGKAAESLVQAEEALAEAGEAKEEAARCRQLADVRSRRLAEVEALREEAVQAAAKAGETAAEASERREVLEGMCSEMEDKVRQLQEKVDAESAHHMSEAAAARSAVDALQSKLDIAEAACQAGEAASKEASAAAAAREAAQAERIEELEGTTAKQSGELQQLKLSLERLQSRKQEMEAGLTGLGLEAATTLKAFKDNLMGTSDQPADIERTGSGGVARPPRKLPTRRTLDSKVESRGAVSRRFAMLFLYFIALHIVVMVSFTSRTAPHCGEDAVDGVGMAREDRLPGH